jgi:hypothetical protein
MKKNSFFFFFFFFFNNKKKRQHKNKVEPKLYQKVVYVSLTIIKLLALFALLKDKALNPINGFKELKIRTFNYRRSLSEDRYENFAPARHQQYAQCTNGQILDIVDKFVDVMNAFMYLVDDHLLEFYTFMSSFGIPITFMYYIDVPY